MACSKYTLTNTGSTLVNFNYRRCDDSLWEYQVELNPSQSKNIWLIDNTYSIASSFKNSVSLVNQGVFPLVSATQTPTPTNTPTPTQTPTQTQTPTNTGTPTQTPTQTSTQTGTPTNTPTPTNTETPTSTPTETPTQTETPTPTQTPTNTPSPTPTFAYYTYSLGYGVDATEACDNFIISPTTIYGTVSGGIGPNVGEFLYETAGIPLSDAAPDGWYSNGTASFEVTGGSGEITFSDPNGCGTPVTITLEGFYFEGSVGAGYQAIASQPLDDDLTISFTNVLGTITGTPLLISGSVEILSGQTSGYTQTFTDYDYNNLTEESSFTGVTFEVTGSTQYNFTGETSGSTFNVTPTPTPSVTPTGTPGGVTPTPTLTPTETSIIDVTPTPTATVTATVTSTPGGVTPTPTATPTSTISAINVVFINSGTTLSTISSFTDSSGSVNLFNVSGSFPVTSGQTLTATHLTTNNAPTVLVETTGTTVNYSFARNEDTPTTGTITSSTSVAVGFNNGPLLSTDTLVFVITD